MKRLSNFTWLRQVGIALSGAALATGTIAAWTPIALSAPKASETALNSAPSAMRATTRAMQNLKKSNKRWLEVNVTTQRLIAWEGNKPVYAVIVSTGKYATPTPTGVFAIQSKIRSARMQGDDYDVPNVPYTMFYDGNYAIHGAYWHNRFGTPVSHGCVNVAPDKASWFYRWASVGTPVVVRD